MTPTMRTAGFFPHPPSSAQRLPSPAVAGFL
jgi:hypothetical protein